MTDTSSTPAASTPAAPLARTPLHALSLSLGAKMVPFAGYDMPAHYSLGVLGEHQHVRAQAGLFDVSHMGQAFVVGANHDVAARALEALCPADLLGLAPGRQRYTQLLNENGGIVDDLMISRSAAADEDGALMLVVNASRKDVDFDHIEARLPAGTRLIRAPHRALIALQGPLAEAVLSRHCPEAASLAFMSAATLKIAGLDCHVSRSGYTGEDGFEISIRGDRADRLARALLAEPEVLPIGLGARDSLRLEAGLCLYGRDIDESISPVEAGLEWSIGKRRVAEGGFAGAERVQREIAEGPQRKRVGVLPDGRAPARTGTLITTPDETPVGVVTSGGFGPSLNAPLAMGYVVGPHAEPGTELMLVVRGTPMPARVAAMPFIPHRYKR